MGDQACGDIGPGRMSEPDSIVEFTESLLRQSQCMKGLNVVVTAGPTREPLDPVRFVSNYSSGRQGFAVARAARQAGANVTLISGPVALEAAPDIDRIDVESASEMKSAVLSVISTCDVFFLGRCGGRLSTHYEEETENKEALGLFGKACSGARGNRRYPDKCERIESSPFRGWLCCGNTQND